MQKSAKLNETIELDTSRPATLVRTPDGSVATCRASYTVRAEGTHVFLDSAGKTLAKVQVAGDSE